MCGKSPEEESRDEIVSSESYMADTRLDYFFLDPLFIIGMLVLLVIIVIIWSWWKQRAKLLAEGGGGADEEKQTHSKTRPVEIPNKNVEALQGMLNGNAVPDDEDGNETEALLSSANEQNGKHTSFGPITKLYDGSKDSSGSKEGEEDEEIHDPDNLATIIPDKDFRDFPKNERDMTIMRRKEMYRMLCIPPLV